MAFGIIRARNLSAGDIAGTDKHNARRYEKIEDYPGNIDPEKHHEFHYRSGDYEDYDDKHNLQDEINLRLEKNNVKGIRKNSNIAIEYVCTISDKKVWERYNLSGFAGNTRKWLEERHGKGSVIASFEHSDESNPHVHIIVMPLKEKTVKWKNQKGQGERTETRLNTREFTGGGDKLRKLQDDYFKHLGEKYGHNGYKLGVKLYRGTRAEHQEKEYSQQTNKELGVLRDRLLRTKDNVLKLEIELEMARKSAEKMERELNFSNEKRKTQKYNKSNWMKKGTKKIGEIFHSKNDDGIGL